MQNQIDKMDFNSYGIKPFFPVKSNPSRRADFCVHRNTASCVLSISKTFRMLKTTCPCREQKTSSEVDVLYELKWLSDEREQQKAVKKDGATA